MHERRYFKTSEAKWHTLSETIERYINFTLPTKPKSEPDQKTQLEWWKEEIGHFVLTDVTPALIAQHRDKLAQGESPSEISLAPMSL